MNKANSRLLVVLIVSNSLSLCVSAQSSGSSNSANNSKLFMAWGFSPALSFECSPSFAYTAYSQISNYPAAGYTYEQNTVQAPGHFTWDEFVFIYKVRYNLKEYDANHSLSLSVLPAIGAGESFQGGLGSFNIPLMIEYNSGNVATYTSDQDKGIVLGVGIEYTNAPLLALYAITAYDANGNIVTISQHTGWVEPVAEFGYRYWNKRNKAKEFNIKFGYGGNGAFTARLSWLKYIGY